MALFGLTRILEPELRLVGSGLFLRPAATSDFAEWAELRYASRDFLIPWEPTWPDDDLTRSAFRRRLRRQAQEMARDESYPFLIFDEARGDMLGGITLGGLRRGVSQTGTLGYWMGAAHAGQGVMSRAVGVIGRWSFHQLSLHRLEAACLPENTPSRALLERNGFQFEGLARQYLRINGVWRDHRLYALLEHEASRLV